MCGVSPAQLAADTVGRLEAIDALIAETAERWRPERMAVVDRLILRMAVCELVRDAATPPAVVINEAIELGRTFSTEESVKFINGMLDGDTKENRKMSALMSSEEEQIAQRRSNLDALAKLGVEIYPHAFDRRTPSPSSWRRTASAPTTSSKRTGRTRSRAAAFSRFDRSAKRTSLPSRTATRRFRRTSGRIRLPPLDFEIFKLLDFGDWIGVEGRLFRTKTNELTIWASRLHFLSKCLLPLPGEVARA